MLPNPLRKKSSKILILFTCIFVGFLGFFWTGDSPLDERILTLRLLLFALCGFIAFSTPYLLFPDRNVPVIQLGNLCGKELVRYLLMKVFIFFWPVFLLFGVLLFVDVQTPLEHTGKKIIYFLTASGLFGGLLLIALTRYTRSGPNSQFWQESEKGRKIRQQVADYFKYPLDPGSIPSLINTIWISVLGMMAIVVAAILSGLFGAISELIVALVVFAWGVAGIRNLGDHPERDTYSTNAFFREFFGSSLKGEEITSDRKVEQLWWVPFPLKVHVWQFLLQLDRVIPAGRVVAAGHLVVWFIAYQKPDPEFITAVWVLFAISHQLFTVLTMRVEMAPGWILRWLGPESIWFFSRFWMQLRWLLPLLLSMNIQFFFFGTPGWTAQGLVFILFFITSMIAAAVGVAHSAGREM